MQEVSTASDGRTARALRTRNAVVDALLDLIEEHNLRPSAAQVAERAGVSLRSVYQHFDDVETLFRVAGERHQQRLSHLEPVPALPAHRRARVRAFVSHRAGWLEAISPMARAAALQAPFSAAIAERQAAALVRHRAVLGAAFAPELSRSAEPERLLNALTAAVAWSTWEGLRRGASLPVEEAAAVVELTLLGLLDRRSTRPGG
jgi:TetR/AcrR family transcriptional regulator of autoinduction and epiphytic fitness